MTLNGDDPGLGITWIKNSAYRCGNIFRNNKPEKERADYPNPLNPKKEIFSLVIKPPHKLALFLSGTERTDSPSEPRKVNFFPRTETLNVLVALCMIFGSCRSGFSFSSQL